VLFYILILGKDASTKPNINIVVLANDKKYNLKMEEF